MNLFEKSLEQLFVSKVRVKSLQYFLQNTKHPIHLRALVRELDEEINAVRREVMRLVDMELLLLESKGNRKYFNTNTEHPFFEHLLKIFYKSFGLGHEIISNKSKLGDVNFAILTNSYTKELQHSESTVDLILIGNIETNVIENIIEKFEKNTSKEVRYTILKLSEFTLRKRRRDRFILDLIFQDNLMLIGSHSDFMKDSSY